MDARSDHNQYGHTLVIAGTGSSVGKTSIALGMTAALVRRGVAVQPYKVGPDFLDPTYLRLAAGRECYNLDGWMCGQSYVQRLFERLAADAEINIIEGVMGLFDGADTGSLAGSTAEIASWLRAPVLLVVNAHGMGKSFAAMVKGYTEFDPSVHIAGVIANKVGSDSHTALLRDALEANALPELIGAIPRSALPKLPSRHLGLISADSTVISDSAISTLADACERFININKLSSRLSDTACPPSPSATALPQTPHVKIGVARDKAFHFCYPDNIRAFEENGAEIRYFSPLQDAGLPDDLDAVYLPGGYPEEHVEQLAANNRMKTSLKDFAVAGGTVYGECGGLMYLGTALTDRDGHSHSMTGIIPIRTRCLTKFKRLGYTEVSMQSDTLWGPAGTTLRGHEFHYSEIISDELDARNWKRGYNVAMRRGADKHTEGYTKGNILGSYIHLHWAANPTAVKHFITRCCKRTE